MVIGINFERRRPFTEKNDLRQPAGLLWHVGRRFAACLLLRQQTDPTSYQ
jgi:hypothetical protein